MTATAGHCWGILPAAGVGLRMGEDRPKQYLQLAGATVLEHSLGALLQCHALQTVVVALHCNDERAPDVRALQQERVLCTQGGEQRNDSVLAALRALDGIAAQQDWVLVHDAARPCVQPQDIERLIDAVVKTGCGGLLAEPVMDTVKRADNSGRVLESIDRSNLWRAQTPQMFRYGELVAALEQAAAQGRQVTDEASAMEMAGYPVQLIPGSPSNLKITVPADLPLAQWWLEQRKGGNS
tara:strand:- start:86925 stop:87641 length:717 start_codon:yes stop_codon:yes gene_type:complete